jgi:O-methyltransferase involved in polyketide biosynthesis
VKTCSRSGFEMEVGDTACRPNKSVFALPIVIDLLEETRREGCNETGRDRVAPNLVGISETMLWSLHNRASEAKRPGGILIDPDSVRIQSAINYDFALHFGDSVGSLGARAAEIDRTLRLWLEDHPDGWVVSLGEGLETQSRRVDNGRLRWLSVDLPDAIRLRERFLTPSDRFSHIAATR